MATTPRGMATASSPSRTRNALELAASMKIWRCVRCAVNDALESLARLDERRAQVVELRFFGGLSVEETAQALRGRTRPYCFNAAMPFKTTVIVVDVDSGLRRWIRKRLPSRLGT